MKIGLIAFTAKGRAYLQRVAQALTFAEPRIYDKTSTDPKTWLESEFDNCEALIFVGATGIAVRLLAPLLKSKDRDPAVLVLDEAGRFVIPLVSGHIGGANALARELAAKLDLTAVITTATDLNNVWAVDVWATQQGCAIENIATIKHVSAALLNGATVGFCSDFPLAGRLPQGLAAAQNGVLGVCVSLNAALKPFDVTLNVVPKIVTLGVGCRKNTSFEDLESFALQTLALHHLSPKALQNLATIELKRDEPCLRAFAEKYNLGFKVFTADELKTAPGSFSGSAFVKSVTGVGNVCERAAVLAAQGQPLFGKTAHNGITLAAAASVWQCAFD